MRARIYDNLGIKFERIAKGIYRTINSEEVCVVIEGDGRDLSMIEDGSIDSILTDHPWLDPKSNKGGSRFFCGNAKKILRRISQFPEDIERNDRKMFYKCCLKAYNEAIREMHRARLGFAGDKWRCKIES